MQIGSLVIICAAMLCGALFAGYVPLVLAVSEDHLQLMSGFGGGLLIGAALAVVLPEGFQAFRNAPESFPESAVGASLLAGFITMLLLDHVQRCSPHLKHHQACHADHSSDPEDQTGEDGLVTRPAPSDGASRAVVGLLIHSAADGLALGAASVAKDASLGIIVAVAIVLHKAPVAFGLTTYLMASRWRVLHIRLALLYFACMSPVATLLTFFTLSSLPWLTSSAAIALCVLFSGGTFLYAATLHILPEVMGRNRQLSWTQLCAVTAGACVPLIFSSIHHHDNSGRE